MKIIVFGANGKVGRLVVHKLLGAGHVVVAFVHRHTPERPHENLTVFEGDIYDRQAVARAMQGCEVVISTLGSWGTPKQDILTTGMKHIIPAMKEQGTSRIVSLTGSDARWSRDELTLTHRVSHLLLMLIAPKVLQDGETHLELLSSSGLDWTVLRSPVMNESSGTGYRLSEHRPPPWATINRHAVAQAIYDECLAESQRGTSPYLMRK